MDEFPRCLTRFTLALGMLMVWASPSLAQSITANDDSATLEHDQVATIDFLANDEFPGGSIKLTSQPDHGYAYVGAGHFVYTPDLGFVGTDSFGYELCLDSGTCDRATVRVEVSGPVPNPGDPNSRPPRANDDQASGLQGQAISINYPANDVSSGNDSLTIKTQPRHGSVKVGAGEFVYTSDPRFIGTDSFVYELCGVQSGRCDSALVTVVLSAVAPKDPVLRGLPMTGISPAFALAVGLMLVAAGLLIAFRRS